MEVYTIGGKPLMLDGKLCKVAAGGGEKNETWVLNGSLDDTLFSYSINFLCNSIAYNSISRRIVKAEVAMYYGSTRVMRGNGTWTNQAYRTITFLEPPTGELLTWLQANGVKQ